MILKLQNGFEGTSSPIDTYKLSWLDVHFFKGKLSLTLLTHNSMDFSKRSFAKHFFKVKLSCWIVYDFIIMLVKALHAARNYWRLTSDRDSGFTSISIWRLRNWRIFRMMGTRIKITWWLFHIFSIKVKLHTLYFSFATFSFV